MSPPSTAAAAVEAQPRRRARAAPAALTEAYAPSEPVRQAFAAEAPALRRAAHLDRRAAAPTLQGLLRVEPLIATDGTVSEATLVEDSVGDAPFAAAILAIVRAMRFPGPGRRGPGPRPASRRAFQRPPRTDGRPQPEILSAPCASQVRHLSPLEEPSCPHRPPVSPWPSASCSAPAPSPAPRPPSPPGRQARRHPDPHHPAAD